MRRKATMRPHIFTVRFGPNPRATVQGPEHDIKLIEAWEARQAIDMYLASLGGPWSVLHVYEDMNHGVEETSALVRSSGSLTFVVYATKTHVLKEKNVAVKKT